MPKKINFESVVSVLRNFHTKHKRLPSFSELGRLLGYRSKGGVGRLMAHLIDRGIVKKDAAGRLIPASLLTHQLKVLGNIQAGFPSPAEEELVDTLSLDEFLIRNPDSSYLVRVSGDSMTGAGIQPGDLVIVERGREPKSGDIVIAQVDGEWTMKYYIKKGKQISLKAANPKYPLIKPSRELVIGGTVVACIRKYA